MTMNDDKAGCFTIVFIAIAVIIFIVLFGVLVNFDYEQKF